MEGHIDADVDVEEEEDEKSGNIFILNSEGKILNSSDTENDKQMFQSSDGEEDVSTNKPDTPDGEAPKRTLFGPPSWNPLQLATAIKAVLKDGVSLTNAAREHGIPRTTLSNKIYGRKKRKVYSSVGKVSSTGGLLKNLAGSHTHVISSEHERLLAEFLSKHKHVDSFSMTRAVFDIVKYYAREKVVLLHSDEYVKDWIKFFFLRYPAARFTIWNSDEPNMLESEENRKLMNYVFEIAKTEIAEHVKQQLFSYILTNMMSPIHLFWWYTFLVKNTAVKKYFMENLKFTNTILDHCLVESTDDEKIYTVLTNIICNRSARPTVSSPTNPLNTPYPSTSENVKLITSSETPETTESPTQVNARRSFDPPYRFILPKSLSSAVSDNKSADTPDGIADTPDAGISSTSKSSFSVMLAQEGLRAVERKLSDEDLRYFNFRYERSHLEEAYEIWRNLKTASEKKESDTES